jgi:alanyl-tRNA synthetase
MDIRKEFLNFFKENDHLILPSSSLIPDNDASVLLTTAGMQQFKPYYLGVKKPPFPRISTVQKSFRTSDIENIGKTDRHLTFFEMLGNFAFADYFKKEAIALALRFLSDILKIPENKLWITVFGGYGDLPMDKEAENYWMENGIPGERIYKFGMKDNFWGPAGDTGPCGPSTEIYYDFGPDTGCGRNDCNPGCGCSRFIEIWNLVFTQYNYNGREYLDLPNKNIDTGMGLERIYSAVNGSNSVFNTPLFKNIVSKISEIADGNSENNYEDEIKTRAKKIISDHCRAIYFLISDGVMPSNEGRGYILRRIIRRAIRYGRLINVKDYFLNEIGKVIINDYGEAYPELESKKEISFQVVHDEEKKFSNTLKDGMKILLQNISELKEKKETILSPENTFRLYDTYGFPVELTEEILKESNLSVDIAGFNEFMKNHIKKSKEKTGFDKSINEYLDFYRNLKSQAENEFIGYEHDSSDTVILKIVVDEKSFKKEKDVLQEGQKGEIVIRKTPFYGERGGAVGDRGTISSSRNGHLFEVNDTIIPFEGLIIHKGIVRKGSFKVGDNIHAEVDISFRKNISRNHTATHLLHWALRSLLGSEVEQAGSFVSDERLRFDYKFFGKYEEDIIDKAEMLINKKITDNDIVKIFETSWEYAQEIGAMALFEEKYGRFVRVVEIGNYSRELCGGIHVKRTGEIGLFKILSDTGIGTNLRRIEAVTGTYSYGYFSASEKILKNISDKLNADIDEIEIKIDKLKTELEAKNEKYNRLLMIGAKNRIFEKYGKNASEDYKIFEYDFSCSEFGDDLNIKNLGILTDDLKEFYRKGFFCVFSNIVNNKPMLVFSCTPDITDKGIDCSKIAREAAKIIKGGGGGKPEFSQAGGSDSTKIGEAADFALKMVKDCLGLK